MLFRKPTRADYERLVNLRAVEVLTAQSPGQREGARDRLIDALIDVVGPTADNFDLRRAYDRALETANPNRHRRI
jgi:hypothetical protein